MARPQLRLVLAVSLDGRLAPPQGGAAQIGGRGDRQVLEQALAWSDGALIGAETLRRHGTTCLIHGPDLLADRLRSGRPRQPHALVVSRSGNLPAALPFFRQPLQRWLLLADQGSGAKGAGAKSHVAHRDDVRSHGVQSHDVQTRAGLDSSLALNSSPAPEGAVARAEDDATSAPGGTGFDRVHPFRDWDGLLQDLAAAGLRRLVVLGGAALAGSLLGEDRLDALQLTICPVLLGGAHSWLAPELPLPAALQRGWRLAEQRLLGEGEVLLHYHRLRGEPPVAAATAGSGPAAGPGC